MEKRQNSSPTDPILEFQAAYQVAKEARKDNIWVTFRRHKGVMSYRVIKTPCLTFESYLAHVKFYQSFLAPCDEVRSTGDIHTEFIRNPHKAVRS